MTTVAEVLGAVDRLAPFRLAETWDNVGLILGDRRQEVRRILVSLDLSDAVCDEAAAVGADLHFMHHPPIFKAMERLTTDTSAGRLALRVLGDRRSLIAAHTNLDSARGGLCDLLAGLAGMEDLRPLQPTPPAWRYKAVVFVPEEALDAVRAAAFAAGAGHIGHYTECSFSADGEGTFLPGEAAHPSVGEIGKRSTVRERRLEMLIDERRIAAVVAAIHRVHPYEEPVIDVYPLHGASASAGIGRSGRLAQPTTLGDLAERIRRALGSPTLGVAGDPSRLIERVALVTGSGSSVLEPVVDSGAQVYLTGELKYHEVEELAARGVSVILGGHYRTERVPLEAWTPRLANELPGVEVRLSERERDSLVCVSLEPRA
jgi:dinuclear metal center YbgI/SA1388 family protein